MTAAFAHLTEKAREVLTLAPHERLAWFEKDHWVGYGQANKILARMEMIRVQPKSNRMQNLLIAGATFNGKSSLIERFKTLHPPKETPEGIKFPVLAVEFPPVPDELRFYNRMLEVLQIPYNPGDTIRKREPQIHSLLPSLGVEALLIDEIHNMLAGHPTKQRQMLNALRSLSNLLKIGLVCAGTREAARGLSVDPQLANRFPPMPLPLWEPDAQWQRLITSFECLMPLPEPSFLGAREAASQIFALAEGMIGELKLVLAACLKAALTANKSRVDSEILKNIDFVPPSRRRDRAEKLG